MAEQRKPPPALPWGARSLTTAGTTAFTTSASGGPADERSCGLEELGLKAGDKIEARAATGARRGAPAVVQFCFSSLFVFARLPAVRARGR